MSKKVAIITDVHWGARNDSTLFIDFFERFYKGTFFPTLKSQGIKTILMLGDTFDRRKYTSHATLHQAKRIFFDEAYNLGINIHMIAGNHDTAFKNTNEVNSPRLLLNEYNNINVIDSPSVIDVLGVKVCMVPWICSDNYEQSFELIKATDSDICMGHFEIAGFAMYRGMESREGLNPSLFDKFDTVFSGHYHHKSSLGNIHYLGNPYELTWQDYADPRGFHLFDPNTRELEFIKNPNTIFKRLEYNDTQQIPDLDAIDLKDCFVRIVVTNKTDYYQFDKFIQKLYTKGCFEIKIMEDLSEYSEGVVDDSIDLEDTMSILANYVDSVANDDDKEDIKSFMKTLYTEALNEDVV
jgi:DNA repair exonuclease SbcCD nuclease subunit